ncbi:MAG TPA: heme lyase CcmF/NrfE family subunit [Longimicrobiales bacterium]|nr:heme lyase CcmF/NrfE family subunit [Longimicrobiales bacterium]
MTLLGEFALWISLPVALWGMVLGYAGGRTLRGDLVLSAERSIYAVFGLLILASAGVMAAFLGDRFEYWYVASYANRELELFYKITGLWAGQRGSLLFWALLLALFASIAVFANRRKNREFMPYVAAVLQTILGFFIIVLLFADVNPFERLGFTPANGQGLNPQLQNYWMTIHPPTLYLGFTAFTIPFAFAVAALLNGRLDARWIQLTRRWILTSWLFLSVGIVFGMRWAYEELGWGGYWFWDPVENASLLPWLTATAFLHSIQIQENRGMLKVWNMSLVLLTFLLTIFATFLTRSGLIESVHSFAQELKIAFIFLGFMGTVTAASIILILYRLPQLRSENRIESFFSRESAFLFNNLILVGAAFSVMFGTIFPLISEGFTGQEISVGPPFFERVNFPIGLVLLALVGIGPVIAWRRATRKNLQKNFATPVVVGLVVAAALWSSGARHGLALTTWGISAFVLTIIFTEFWKGTRARARIEGEGYVPAFFHLVSRNRRRWGGYTVHVGIVMMFMAFAGAAYNVDERYHMEPGDVVEVTSPLGHTYSLRHEGLSVSLANGQRNLLWQAIVTVSVSRDGEPQGILTTEKRQYTTQDMGSPPMTEVGIKSYPLEDLYLILSELDDMQGAVSADSEAQGLYLQVLVKPLVSWIWLGCLILAGGTIIGLWPSVDRRKSEVSARADAVPEPVSVAATD